MKLFYSQGACSLAPHIVLQEAGLKYELEPVNLKSKHYRGGDYNQVNPKGSVPAIETDDGKILTETAVIMQYISDLKPEAGLLPMPGTIERYRGLEWLSYLATEVHKGFGPLWHPKMPQEAKDLAWETLGRKFVFLSERLEGGFLMGSKFSAPDAYLFTLLNWVPMLKKDLAAWPQLQDFVKRVSERPAVKAAMSAEGIKAR